MSECDPDCVCFVTGVPPESEETVMVVEYWDKDGNHWYDLPNGERIVLGVAEAFKQPPFVQWKGPPVSPEGFWG